MEQHAKQNRTAPSNTPKRQRNVQTNTVLTEYSIADLESNP